MQMLNLVASCSLLVSAAAAARIAYRLAAPDQPSHRIIVGGLAFYALLIVPLQVGATVQLIGLFQRVPLWTPIVASAIALLVLRRKPPAQPAASETRAEMTGAERAGYLVIGLLWLALLASHATAAPTSWDAVAYRLPLAVRWLQEGTLIISSHQAWQESLPGNGELVAMLSLATGWQSLAEIVLVPAGAVAVAAVGVLAQWLGADRSAARACCVLAASLPIVVFQAFSAYVDLFGAAFVLGALAILTQIGPGTERGGLPRLPCFFLAGLGCGLAAGTKPTLWPFAAVAAGILAVGSARAGGPRLLVAVATGVLAPALFWFARATILTGNPLFPLSGQFLGFVFAPGTTPTSITPTDYDLQFVRTRLEWLIYPWVEFKLAGNPFSTGSGLGPAFAAFVPIGVLYTVTVVHSARVRGVAMGLALAVVVWATALHRVPRFGIFIVLGMCGLAGPFIQAYRVRAPRAFAALWVTALGTGAAITSLVPLTALGYRVARGERDRASSYDLPPWLDRLPAGSTVINLNPSREYFNNFALAGRHLGTTVVPYWRALESLPTAPCGAWIVDRVPFQSLPDSIHLLALGYRPVAGVVPAGEADAWRFWRRDRLQCHPA